MGGLSECALDRHFAAQLRVISNLKVNKLRKSDHGITQQWLKIFSQVSGQEKYARNCLMLLMYGQLKEMGRLGKPFTDPRNTQRHLDDVLSEYNGKIYMAKPDSKDNDDALTNMACCGDISHTTEDDHLSHKLDHKISSIKDLWQANQKFIKEIDLLHSQTSDLALDSKNRKLNTQKQISFQLPNSTKTKGENNPDIMSDIWKSSMQAMNRLKKWTGPNEQIDFLSTCLQHEINNMPELQEQVAKLDRHFEHVVNFLIEQTCERHDKNMMNLYDRLFKQQKELQQVKEEHLRQLNHMLEYQNRQKQISDEQFMWEKNANRTARATTDRYGHKNSKTQIESEYQQCYPNDVQTTEMNFNANNNVGDQPMGQPMYDNGSCSYCKARSQ
ncbi:uncharacterized protein Dwil_GK17010 [Drosophila willistoni]|uniref:DUF4485 domain-containing protein n=1 Tax=Drosophila willistoni TaxID=7260 RepID=B4MKQ7_DROWI|nr:uncharacterized protein LOC6639465 [Drosophila willistoni]EDW72763.1 uncharacterized protein Dwil_GK17010 [Drosophila willistoni]